MSSAARGRDGATLLHQARTATAVRDLLAAGHAVDARDARGRTPLMWDKDADATRLLLEAGADVHAVDARGDGVLAIRANPPDGAVVGYSPPDFAALDVLIAAGVPRPTAAEATTWIGWADKLVCAASEANDATRFRRWVEGVLEAPDRAR